MRTQQERKSKARRDWIVAEHEVESKFDDAHIRKLVIDSRMSPVAKTDLLGPLLREAVWFYAHEVRVPNANELYEEISRLYGLADRALRVVERERLARHWELQHIVGEDRNRETFEAVAKGREDLSLEAVERLKSHGGPELPLPKTLRDAEEREAACKAIVELCSFGGSLVSGRRRPSGKRSRDRLRLWLYAPRRSSGFGKRDADLNFVERLEFVWKEVTGKSPPSTADRRKPGPFARFVKECFDLAGAKHVNVVKLINGLQDRRRHAIEAGKMSGQGLPVVTNAGTPG